MILSLFPPSKLTLGESTTVTVDQTFSDSELKYFQKLECTIHNAFLEVNEFALYSVLETLLGMYADSFPTLERLDSKTFIHVTPQDILTGSMRVCSISGEERFRMIPDATVRITRLYPGQDKRDHHMVLVIEAKRLVPVLCGRRSTCSILYRVLGVVTRTPGQCQNCNGTPVRRWKRPKKISHVTFPSSCSRRVLRGRNPLANNASMSEY